MKKKKYKINWDILVEDLILVGLIIFIFILPIKYIFVADKLKKLEAKDFVIRKSIVYSILDRDIIFYNKKDIDVDKNTDESRTEEVGEVTEEIYNNIIIETDTPAYEFDDYTVTVLAKIIYGEARGISSYEEKAGIVWCILNRADNWNRSILSVALEENQFYYYENAKTVDDYGTDLKALVIDVLTQHQLEKDGYTANRILPIDYMWYWGDGSHNYFRNAFNGNFDVWEF